MSFKSDYLQGSNIPRPLRPNDQPTSSTALASNGQDGENNTSSLVNDIARKYKEHDNEITKASEKKDKGKAENANHGERNLLKSSTVTSEGASVATSTTVVTLPVLPPLTTKYAAPAPSQPASVSDPKVSTTTSQPSSSSGVSKHKHRSSHDEGTPSKKHKSHHSSRSAHGSHSSHKGKSSSHSSDSSSPGKRPHGKPPGHPSSSSSSHKSSTHASKHHHHAQQAAFSSHKGHSTHRPNPHHSSHSSSLKLIPPSPTLGLLDKKRLTGTNKPSPPIPRDHDTLPPPPPPPPPPSDDHPMSSSSNVYGSRQPSLFSSIEQLAPPPPPPPEPAPKSPPPPPPPPF